MDIISAFGEAVKDIIDDGEITVEQFAEKINLNSSEVYRFLRKERLPQLSTIIAIADGYNCSVDYLLGYTQFQNNATYLKTPDFFFSFAKLLKDNNTTRYGLSKTLKISIKRLDDWYFGRHLPSVENILKLKKHFDCTFDELLGRV